MKSLICSVLLLANSTAAPAQLTPSPSLDDPRLQTVPYDPAQAVRLVAFPDTNLTVILLPGDQIERIDLSDHDGFEVAATGSNDSFNIVARRPGASTALVIRTAQRRYEFKVETSGGIAAYVVRFLAQGQLPAGPVSPPILKQGVPSAIGMYRISGERQLRPTRIGDDGERTYIEWSENQSLPAVFGVGPTGQEEVADGHMRNGLFTIDRIYGELIFRIDKKQATARRLKDRSSG